MPELRMNSEFPLPDLSACVHAQAGDHGADNCQKTVCSQLRSRLAFQAPGCASTGSIPNQRQIRGRELNLLVDRRAFALNGADEFRGCAENCANANYLDSIKSSSRGHFRFRVGIFGNLNQLAIGERDHSVRVDVFHLP